MDINFCNWWCIQKWELLRLSTSLCSLSYLNGEAFQEKESPSTYEFTVFWLKSTDFLTPIIALELMHSCGFETCHKHTTFLEWLTPRTLRMTYYVLVISVSGIDFVPVRAQITFRLQLQFFFSANQWVLWVQNWLTEDPSTLVLVVDISGILCGPGLKKEWKTITGWVCRTCGPIVRWSQSCIPLRGDPEQHVKC